MSATINPAVGDTVTVDEGCLPEDWSHTGEVVGTDGQSFVVGLEDGNRCDVLPDQLRVVGNGEEPADVTVVNLTPHPVTIAGHTIAPTGTPPRCSTTTQPVAPVRIAGQDIPVEVVGVGAVTGLPEPIPGTIYIVSRMIAEAAPHRRDLYIPHKLERDGQGRVIGCAALGQVAPEGS